MTSPITILSLGLAAALTAAFVAYVGARVAAVSGPMHEPRAGRSSHATVTPSGGGLGIVAGVMAALVVVGLARPAGIDSGIDSGDAMQLAGLATVALFIAEIGLLDDLFDWAARLKFALLGATSAGVVAVAGAPLELPLWGLAGVPMTLWVGMVGGALWAFTAKNAVNFMDGADGLVGGTLAIASAGLAVLAGLAGAMEAMVAAAALAGALLGFLPVNAPKARVFMGDAGSLFCGAWFAGASLLFIAEAPRGAVYLPALLLLPILADVLLTLAWHVKHKIPVLKPHLDHAYQVRIRGGDNHAAVVRVIWARAALLAALAVGSFLPAARLGEPGWALGGLALGAALAALWWRGDRMGLKPAQ